MATLAAVGGCGPRIPPARLAAHEPLSEAELDSAERVATAPCSPRWGLLFPGLGQMCLQRRAAGATLMAVGAAEIGTAAAVAAGPERTLEHPGAALPLLALQDLWLIGFTDYSFDVQRAERLRFVPQDRLADLAWAPFNLQVLREPDVWLGLLGSLAGGIAVSLAVDETFSTDHFGDDPNLFGREVDPLLGYPAAAGVGAGLFTHVALAEEGLFRGMLQSGLARQFGEWTGWAWASALFGAAHSLNALALPEADRKKYLLIGVPYITALGGYLGWSYKRHDYSLAPSVAVHFWYDFLLSATFFALDPTNSPVSARVSIPF